MAVLFARKAFLDGGWAEDVRIGIDGGRIAAVDTGTAPGRDDQRVGTVIPGLANGHSHAFQRALVGRSEQRAPQGNDSFWTWRERMYALAAKLDGDTMAAVAAQAYSEMIESGYTAVAEFHYLLSSPALGEAIFEAADISGIRLTYVPVLYERAGFDAQEPEPRQRLFVSNIDAFLDAWAGAGAHSAATVSVGIGAHSLRAVSKSSLAAVAGFADERQVPMHLHVAEQQREVEQCLASYGCRPVRWLLDNLDIGGHWCLVHATHMDSQETAALAASGAVVCLCPSTEANLGDGLFPLAAFVGSGGAVAIGSDSQVTIDPFEELRWLEYGQRLATGSRNVVSLSQAHTGRELFERALQGGARAAGHERAGLQPGAHADLVVLNDDDPMLLGHDEESLLDALIFSGYRLPIDRVMVHGRWQVIDGEHVARPAIRARFRRALEQL